MSFYRDLTEYEYDRTLLPYLNVGWLEKGHQYPVGEAPAWLVPALGGRLDQEAHIYRGCFSCQFCDEEQIFYPNANGRGHVLGHGEFWIGDGDNGWFAAPTMIIHYIDAHGYLPPISFVKAVRAQDPDDAALCRVDNLFNAEAFDVASLGALVEWLKAANSGEESRSAGLCVRLEGERLRIRPRMFDEAGVTTPGSKIIDCSKNALVTAIEGYLDRLTEDFCR